MEAAISIHFMALRVTGTIFLAHVITYTIDAVFLQFWGGLYFCLELWVILFACFMQLLDQEMCLDLF